MIVERERKRSGSRCVTVPIRALQVATLPDRDATDSAVRGRNIAGARGAHADGAYIGTCGGERLGHVPASTGSPSASRWCKSAQRLAFTAAASRSGALASAATSHHLAVFIDQ